MIVRRKLTVYWDLQPRTTAPVFLATTRTNCRKKLCSPFAVLAFRCICAHFLQRARLLIQFYNEPEANLPTPAQIEREKLDIEIHPDFVMDWYRFLELDLGDISMYHTAHNEIAAGGLL